MLEYFISFVLSRFSWRGKKILLEKLKSSTMNKMVKYNSHIFYTFCVASFKAKHGSTGDFLFLSLVSFILYDVQFGLWSQTK